MIIKVHRANGINLKLFLDTLGFASVWNGGREDHDELLVLDTDRDELLLKIQDELDRTGFLPYHYLLSPEKKGLPVKGEDFETQAAPTTIVDLKNISGNFRLILFEDGRSNYLWKTYSPRELENRVYQVKAKVVCQLTGKDGENFCLFNLPKFK
jgi:hypothetical protein